jgi:NhaP-type Na+/H+ or K+/H+ antiporter
MTTFKSIDLKRALIGGAIASIMVFLGTYLVGRLGQSEAFVALKEMRPSLRFICSSVLTATSTILALLLTLLSFSSNTEKNLRPDHYERIKWIALLSTIAFSGAVVLLMCLTLPLNNSEEKLQSWYSTLYYGFITYGALLGGIMISIVLMLYQAANAIILIFQPGVDADHLLSSKDSEEANAKENHPEKKREREEEKVG